MEPAKNVIDAATKYFANLFGKREHVITHMRPILTPSQGWSLSRWAGGHLTFPDHFVIWMPLHRVALQT